MKANHNSEQAKQRAIEVVSNISKSKNESKSQRLEAYRKQVKVVSNISKSKNESKSQRLRGKTAKITGCVQYQ